MKTTAIILGVIATTIITILVSRGWMDSDRTQIGALEAQVKSLELYIRTVELDAKTTSDLVDIHQQLILQSNHTLSKMVVGMKMLTLMQTAPQKPLPLRGQQ